MLMAYCQQQRTLHVRLGRAYKLWLLLVDFASVSAPASKKERRLTGHIESSQD